MKKRQSGQVVLITLLMMAVVLTIGMSIVSRSIVDVKTSQQTQESARAFWLAQGELEKAIRANADTGGLQTAGDMVYEVTKSNLVANSNHEYAYPETVKADMPVTIWFVNHNEEDGSIGSDFMNPSTVQIYWGDTPIRKPALEATFVYYDGSFKVSRYAYDPDEGTSGSNFGVVNNNGTLSDKVYSYYTNSIDVSGLDDLYFVKIRLINTAVGESLAIKTGSDIPGQGSCFESESVVIASKITRRLTSCQLWSDTPAIFDNVLFSGTSL